MPNKGKRKAPSSPSFHKRFKPPSHQQRAAAIGAFPGASHTAQRRKEMLLQNVNSESTTEMDRPSLALAGTTVEEALHDLDNPGLYVPTARSQTSFAVPNPRDELDWLCQVPEEGQTFDEYIQFLTLRSGRIRPIANPGGEEIVLLPIVRENGEEACWPAHGPKLEPLVAYTQAFYDRNVRVLPPAVLSVQGNDTNSSTPGAFASAAKGKFAMRFPRYEQTEAMMSRAKVVGRRDVKSGRVQFQVNSLLDQLASFREGKGRVGGEAVFEKIAGGRTDILASSFCVMGITMEDLYDGPNDLFCAGMAAGGSKVAVFSFFRYHPHIQMHPLHWHHYGYGREWNSHSYYDDNDQNPSGLQKEPPLADELSKEADAELLRRSSKLLTHELGHLYGLDHCIFHRCLMMGTGHLVEDFAAPSHLCGICLRKLQWRLGFKVQQRYALLHRAFSTMGMAKEAAWAQKQARHVDAATARTDSKAADPHPSLI